jgi:acetolactate synthase-1/2/3 large subunit
VAVIGDGGFLFANPVACHGIAEAHGLPILMVIFNNARYGAVRNATLAMFPAGAAARDNGLLLADLSPSPPFAALAREQGAFAAHVDRPSIFLAPYPRLGKRCGWRQALVNVITPY